MTLPRHNPALVIKGGVLDGKPLDAAEIAKLADLESREVLLAKLAGGMLASLSQAVYLLNAPLAQAARARRCAAGQGRAGPVGPPGRRRHAGRRRGGPADAPAAAAEEADARLPAEAAAADEPTDAETTEA